jgi:ribonuclease HI
MEITAAIQALRHVSEGQAITIRSDSQYVVKTMTLGWKRDKNTDLWRELETEAVRRKVRWEWVRGHAEDKYNDRADELARNAALGIPTARAKAAQEAVEPSPGKDTDAEVLAALRPMLNPGEDIRRCANCGRAFVASPDLTDALVFCPHIRCQLAERRNKRS